MPVQKVNGLTLCSWVLRPVLGFVLYHSCSASRTWASLWITGLGMSVVGRFQCEWVSRSSLSPSDKYVMTTFEEELLQPALDEPALAGELD